MEHGSSGALKRLHPFARVINQLPAGVPHHVIYLRDGYTALTFEKAISGLLRPDSVDPGTRVILRELRMPMTLISVLVGTCASLAGLMMQSVPTPARGDL